MDKRTAFGVLDLSLVHFGSPPVKAVQETAALAKHADQLGYKRFWVTEHHNNPLLACASPEVLMAHIASVTKQCKVGSGGLLLSNYSALHVAENFKMLEAIFPGRIEMGIGRASGGDSLASAALNPLAATGSSGFEKKLADLFAYFENENAVKAMPATAAKPGCFLLGSSVTSAFDAARLQMPYVYAQFLNPAHATDALSAYARSDAFENKSAGLAVFLACADEEKKLNRRKAYARFYLEHFYSERYSSIIDEAFAYTPSEEDAAYTNSAVLTGTPETLEASIKKLCAETQADHLLLIPAAETVKERMEMLELVAKLPVF